MVGLCSFFFSAFLWTFSQNFCTEFGGEREIGDQSNIFSLFIVNGIHNLCVHFAVVFRSKQTSDQRSVCVTTSQSYITVARENTTFKSLPALFQTPSSEIEAPNTQHTPYECPTSPVVLGDLSR